MKKITSFSHLLSFAYFWHKTTCMGHRVRFEFTLQKLLSAKTRNKKIAETSLQKYNKLSLSLSLSLYLSLSLSLSLYIYIYIYIYIGKFIHQFQPETKTLIRKLERMLIKLYRQNVSLLFNQTCLNERLLPNYTHTHTHTHIYIYIYIYIIQGK